MGRVIFASLFLLLAVSRTQCNISTESPVEDDSIAEALQEIRNIQDDNQQEDSLLMQQIVKEKEVLSELENVQEKQQETVLKSGNQYQESTKSDFEIKSPTLKHQKENSPPSRESSHTSVPAAATRKKMSAADSDHIRKLRLEYTKKLQEEKEAAAAAQAQEMHQKFLKSKEDDDQVEIIEFGTDSYYFERYKIPRHFSKPVENILKKGHFGLKNKPSHYDILGISPKTTMEDTKKAYRQIAVKVHPDKNPHPDARIAFELLTGSYEVLADETLRHDYDERLQMIKSIHNPYKLSNIKKSFATYYDNIKSRLLLFISRLRKLQLREEWNDFNRYFKLKDFRRNTYLLYKKYLLAHSWKDRILISADYLWEMKFTLLLVPAIVLGAKYQLVKPQTNYYVDLF